MGESGKLFIPVTRLKGKSRRMAEAIGIEALYELSKIYGGDSVYIPKVSSLHRPMRNILIQKEFNGYNYEELSDKYGVTVRWIRRICGDGQVPGQISLFDLPEMRQTVCQVKNEKK